MKKKDFAHCPFELPTNYTMEKIANQLEHIRTKPRFFGSEVWELF